MTSTDRDLGPKVPTIFVIAGKKLCPIHHHRIISTKPNSQLHCFKQNTNMRISTDPFVNLRILKARGWKPYGSALRGVSDSHAFLLMMIDWRWVSTTAKRTEIWRERERESDSAVMLCLRERERVVVAWISRRGVRYKTKKVWPREYACFLGLFRFLLLKFAPGFMYEVSFRERKENSLLLASRYFNLISTIVSYFPFS